jgi:hypothetical protein
MAGTPARLKVDIVADSRKARDELDSFSSKVAGFAAGVTASVTTFAIDKLAQGATLAAGAIADGVQAAASLSAALATAQQNYGDATQEIERWSTKAAKALGLSQVEAVQTANRFAVYARQLQLTGKEAANFSTGLTSLAADLAAFSDLPVADAVNAIGSAFRGERDPIERFGIILNDASVKAAYFRKTGEEVNGTLTSQQNIIGTLAALQEQSAVAAGAFAREQDQLGARSQILNAQLDDLKRQIGERLLPVFEQLLNVASRLIETYSSEGISGVWRRLSDTWGGDLDGLRELVAKWVAENIPDFREWVSNASEWLLKVIYGDPANGIPSIFERFTQLTGAIDSASKDGKNTQSLNKSGANIGEAFAGGFIDGVIRYIATTLPSSFARIFTSPETVANLIIPAFSLAQSIGKAIADGIIGFIDRTLLEGLRKSIGGAIDFIRRLLSGAGGFLFGGFGTSSVTGAIGTQTTGPTFGPSFMPANVTINATVPPGVNGYDVGTAIVSQLDDYYQRNGRFPWDS